MRARFLNLKAQQNTSVPQFFKRRRPCPPSTSSFHLLLFLSLFLFLRNPLTLVQLLQVASRAVDLPSLIVSLPPSSPRRGKYMYASGKLCYLVAIQNAIPSFLPPSYATSSSAPGASPRPHRHLFLIQTYFCRPFILPTSSRFPARLRRESKTARVVLLLLLLLLMRLCFRASEILSALSLSLWQGYSTAYLGIHTKKLCV